MDLSTLNKEELKRKLKTLREGLFDNIEIIEITNKIPVLWHQIHGDIWEIEDELKNRRNI